MTAFSTFTYAKKYYVSNELEFVTDSDAEFDTTYKVPDDLINLLSDNIIVRDVAKVGNKVGVGTTTTEPRQTLDVTGTAIVSNRIGINNINPQKELDVTGTAIVSNRIGIGSTEPEQKLDISGSVKINEFIYDSVNSPGVNGYYLSMDGGGIRWVAFEPSFTEGIFIQDEGTYIPITGIAQSFTVVNFKQINSLGLGTDNIIPIPNPLNPNFIADVQSKDFWGFNAAGDIYRMTNVGIQNANPAYTLDITGTLNVTGATTLGSTLDVTGVTKVLNTTQSTDKDTGSLIVEGGVGIEKNLSVGGVAKVFDTTSSTTKDTGALIVEGGVGIEENLNVGGVAKVLSTTQSTDKDTGALIVEGGVGIEKNLSVGGVAKVFDTTQSTDKDTGSIITEGGVGIEKNLSVGGVAKVFDTTSSTTKDTGALIVEGGVGIEENLNVGGVAKVLSTTSSTTKDTGALIVEGGVGIEENLNVGQNTNIIGTLVVGAATTLNSTLQVGVGGTVITTTGIGSVGIGTYNPEFDIDLAKDVKFRKAIIDKNNKVGYDTNFYQTPRSVLTQVSVDDSGEIIGGRFFDAANMIRLNLDFIAAEAVGYITSTDYKNPAFTLTSGNYTSCKDDIKDILKAITVDITKGGNVQSVGAGRSYYSGNTLLYIADPTVKAASIAAVGAAATVARYVINNAPLVKSYQSGVSSIRQIRDLTLQDDTVVGGNVNPNGCSNVVSAIYTCAGIVTTIISSGPNAVPVNNPDGKIIWAPAGADSRNLIWVSKYGNDDNGGNTEGDAKLTIGAAAAIAQPGDTIIVRPGIYYENNPIGLRTDVGVSGQDLRLVTVVPQNTGKDIFHVRRGCLIENMNFACDTGQSNPGGGALAFPPTTTDIVAGRSYGAVTGYLAPGPATEGSSGRWRSPYVRNCTNFMPLSIGMKINGDHAVASTIGADLKCMVCDSFTQYNEAGIGVSITNSGYAQLVSLFTINCDKAVYVDSGGQCDLTNSNSSFGNYGLYAVGLGRTEFTAKVNTTTTAEADIVVFKDVSDGTQVRRPYDGQALWFKINLSNYNTGQTGIITAPLQRLSRIDIINGGSGYNVASPPDISIYDANTNNTNPLGPEGIIAEVSPTISDSGAITIVDIVNSGRNYLSSQNMRVRINGTATNDLVAVMEPIYYTVGSATSPTAVTGITTVTLNEFVPYLIYANDPIEMRRISRILTSGHSFEYIGTGTDINTSTPLKGAVPIKENEIVALDGAQIPYTSTDQKGNFNIGEGIQVNQTTATITGRDFSKAIQAEVTPLILALR
jgi:hypothetical protein